MSTKFESTLLSLLFVLSPPFPRQIAYSHFPPLNPNSLGMMVEVESVRAQTRSLIRYERRIRSLNTLQFTVLVECMGNSMVQQVLLCIDVPKPFLDVEVSNQRRFGFFAVSISWLASVYGDKSDIGVAHVEDEDT